MQFRWGTMADLIQLNSINLYIKSTGLDKETQSRFSIPHLGAAIFTFGRELRYLTI